jgi:copper chaperone
MSVVVAQIDGMSCNHCLNAVNQALAAVPGIRVESVRIGRAEVELLPDGASADAVVAAIEGAGYAVTHSALSG